METVTALLRVAARIAGASAALVALPGSGTPVAAWGVDGPAAGALLRVLRRSSNGAWSFRSYPLVLGDGSPAELVLIAPMTDPDDVTLAALAAEIGAACSASSRVSDDLRDVSTRKQFETALAAEKRKLQTTLAAIADAVVTVLPDGRVEFVNAAAQRLLGIDLADAYGVELEQVIHIVDDEARPIAIVAEDGADGARRGSGHLVTKTGIIDVAYVASRIEAEDHVGGDGPGIVVVLRDVTAEHRLKLRLSFEAAHDPLTGLQNRRAFAERLEEALRGARERSEHHVLAFVDLDRFKVVNDRFGHAIGDRLLREIGQVMGRVVRGGDVLARIGGDEFGLLLANCRVDDARRIAEKLRAAVDGYRIEYGGEELGVGLSIGLAPLEADTASVAQALADADAACYQAKAAGRNAVAG